VADLVSAHEAGGGLNGTKVVVRIGNPCIPSDLRKVSVETARAIIVLAVSVVVCVVFTCFSPF
jgi:hypothetical protein